MLETAETIKGHRATLAAVGLVVAIGALLRFHNLGGESLWADEAASWTEAKDSLADLIKRTADDNYPPLHNLALFAAIKLFGDSEWSLRLPSAIFGVANIVALYWLGSMTVGRTAGLIGAALLALSPFHVWYSQEARMYSLLALAATLYAATSFHYLRAPSLPRGAWVSLAGLALVYSHPYGALDWIAIVVAFAVFVLSATSSPPRTMLVWAASNVIVAAGFAPWVRILASRAHAIAAHGFWIPAPTLPFVLEHLRRVVGGWKAVRRRDPHWRRARHRRPAAQGRGGALRLDRRPSRNRHRGFYPIDADLLVSLCYRLSAAAPPALRLWLDQVRQRLARRDLISGGYCCHHRLRPVAVQLQSQHERRLARRGVFSKRAGATDRLPPCCPGL